MVILKIILYYFLYVIRINSLINIYKNNKNDSLHDDKNFYLELLNISQSDESKDYIINKTQFQLSNLLTEQSHNKTNDLSYKTKNEPLSAIEELITVDEDIIKKIKSLIEDKEMIEKLEYTKDNIKQTLINNGRIYFYGTGSTGRLAKQIENFWRKFWNTHRSIRKNWEIIYSKLNIIIPNLNNIESRVIGDITGGDRALIKSLEGFEDLEIIGKLQLQDYNISSNDMVFAVTEGGETSAVIGNVIAASEIINNENKVYFVYNNPDELLIEFERCRKVLNNPKITKINFSTGPQAITGSTRMQATTSQTFLLATLLESALIDIFIENLSRDELRIIKFYEEKISIFESLQKFIYLQNYIFLNSDKILKLSEIEFKAYNNKSKAVYYGNELITTIFIDITERAPTFSLDPLDSKKDLQKSWIKVNIAGVDILEAWKNLLLREFRGLNITHYEENFNDNIKDPYLKKIAIQSLKSAGADQQYLYDFSINNFNLTQFDVGFAYLLIDEIVDEIIPGSYLTKWMENLNQLNVNITLVLIGIKSEENLRLIYYVKEILKFLKFGENVKVVEFLIDYFELNDIRQDLKFIDPMKIKQKIVLKMILNTQSSYIMAKMNRVLGNSMVYVSPSNLKLIGRATYLLTLHINNIIRNPNCLTKEYFIDLPEIKYLEANALLYDAKIYFDNLKSINGSVPIIPVVFIRIFEKFLNFRNIQLYWYRNDLTWENSLEILNKYESLNNYIEKRLGC